MRTYTLEEQIEGLKGMTTTSPQEFAIKNSILESLGRLQTMRNRLQRGEKLNEDKFAVDLATVLGQPPNRQRS